MTVIAILVSLAFAASAAAEPREYRIAPAEGARFALEVHKTGLMSGKSHVFYFTRYDGILRYDASNPEASSVILSIESSSAECQDDWVKPKQLKDIEEYALDDMMRAKEYPELRFSSESVEAASNGGFTVTGPLTIRGQNNRVMVSVQLQPEDQALRFSGMAVVDLKDYGIKPRRAALGAIGTRSKMDLRFELIALPE